MTKKQIYLVVASDLHQTYNSMAIIGIATKPTDAQKLYSKSLKEYDVTTKNDGTDNNNYIITVYEVTTGEFSENIIRDATPLYSSNG